MREGARNIPADLLSIPGILVRRVNRSGTWTAGAVRSGFEKPRQTRRTTMGATMRLAKAVKTAGFWLWTVQVLLALVFLFAGGLKLVLPIEMLKGPIALPGAFLRFLGTAEVT